MKILIVEDEVLIAEDLKDNLISFGYQDVRMTHTRQDALKAIEDWSPNLVLLDIRMQHELDGIHIGEILQKQKDIHFIYVTSHSDLAMLKQIIATAPSGYITKPFKKSDLLANIMRVEQAGKISTPANSSKISLKDGYTTIHLDENAVYYFESEGNYVTVYHTQGKNVLRQSLESIHKTLNSKKFIRIHRSFIVNMENMEKHGRTEVIIKGTSLPVSRTYQSDFLLAAGANM